MLYAARGEGTHSANSREYRRAGVCATLRLRLSPLASYPRRVAFEWGKRLHQHDDATFVVKWHEGLPTPRAEDRLMSQARYFCKTCGAGATPSPRPRHRPHRTDDGEELPLGVFCTEQEDPPRSMPRRSLCNSFNACARVSNITFTAIPLGNLCSGRTDKDGSCNQTKSSCCSWSSTQSGAIQALKDSTATHSHSAHM